ncbi:MAG: hypothetical protein ACI8ZM_002385 [Crocinitomix sp.]|jgi:hypothetical protein
MHNLIFLSLLFITHMSIAQADTIVTAEPIDTAVVLDNDLQMYKDDAARFAMGRAESGLEYFQGILAGVVLADLDALKFVLLDEQNASVDEFVKTGNLCLMHIASLRESMTFYSDAKWPLSAEFHELTIAWLDCSEGLVNDYYFKLAEAFSKADDDMTDAEWDLYDIYAAALEIYFKIDGEWVDFQYKFAEANGFEIGSEIDQDAMLEPSIDE